MTTMMMMTGDKRPGSQIIIHGGVHLEAIPSLPSQHPLL